MDSNSSTTDIPLHKRSEVFAYDAAQRVDGEYVALPHTQRFTASKAHAMKMVAARNSGEIRFGSTNIWGFYRLDGGPV